MLSRLILITYATLFVGVSGSVLAVQIGGFVGIYLPPVIFLLTLLMIALIGWGYRRYFADWATAFQPDDSLQRPLQISLVLAAFLLIAIVFVLRLGLWPHSVAGQIVPDDFTGYHGPKILTLLQSGSLWTLEIPYGQYPLGYEGFAAFLVALTGDVRAIGASHAVMAVLVWLTLALLMVRWRLLPMSAALFAAALICFVPMIYSQLMIVGKNDLMLSLTILIALLYAPAGAGKWHPVGLAAATMLSLATKATGLYVLFYLWLLVLWDWWRAFRQGKAQSYLSLPTFALLIVLMFPGGLWVIRNVVVMGEPFTSEVASFFDTSILSNLVNPTLWTSGVESAGLIAAVIGLLLLLPLIWRDSRLGWTVAGALLVMAISFASAPLSGFHPTQPDRVHIEWRYGLHGLLLALLIVVAFVWPLAHAIYRRLIQRQWGISLMTAVPLMVSIAMLLLVGRGSSFSLDEGRQAWLTDPYGEQTSIYDAVADLDAGVIYIGPRISWFHLMTANPDLTVTQGLRYPLGRPDVATVPPLDYAITGAGFPPPFADLPEPQQWQLLYEDATGQLYRRLP